MQSDYDTMRRKAQEIRTMSINEAFDKSEDWKELKEFGDKLFAGTPRDNCLIWESKNGIWAIHHLHGTGTRRMVIEDRRIGGICDYPQVFDGRIFYDYPEGVPRYVKDAVAKVMNGVAA
jgi:hypothetical protein